MTGAKPAIIGRAVGRVDDVEEDVGQASRRAVGNVDLHVVGVAERRHRRGRELGDHVDVAVREGADPRVRVLDRLEDERVDVRPSVPVVGVRVELHRDALLVAGELEWPGPDHLLVLEGDRVVLLLPDVLGEHVHEEHARLEIADRLFGRDDELGR